MIYLRLFAALCLSLPLLLTACGGGGGGGGGGNANAAPVAGASAPDNATSGDTVTLSGTGSDSDGSITAWEWEQVAGPTVTLSSANSPNASFTAPRANTPTELAFTLTVTDNRGATNTARVTVTVTPPATAARHSVSGTAQVSPHQVMDSDTNDPNNAATRNDTPATAQSLTNPITLGGYVNQPAAGADGRSSVTGDIDDYFEVQLFEGQTVTLLVADHTEADADLYLYDLQGNIVEFSIETGDMEQVVVPEDGQYAVNVFAFSGGTNYILAIGNPTSAAQLLPRHPIVAGEAILTYKSDHPATHLPDLPTEDLAWRMGMRQRGGGPGRARLLARLAQARAGDRFGPAAGRENQILDASLRERWETLMQIKRLRRSPGVKDASPNYRVQPLFTPDDPSLGYQWHYPLIDLATAWDVSTGTADVVVAVIDTGVLANHPDIRGQLVPGYDFIRSTQLSGDGDGIDPDAQDPGSNTGTGSSSYHGTHVGGTVAAAGNNGTGVAGVAYSARLMPLRALSERGGTSYDVAQAVRYAAGLANDSGQIPARPADIINLSLGGEGFSSITQDLYRQVRQQGVIVVAAAGNEGSSQPGYPASYDGVISVSAVDPQRRITAYSNRGSFIDVAAPGGDSSRDIAGDGYPDGVLSTGGTGAGQSLDYAYTFISGTSMAAPHVSGVLALMKSINPALTPATVDDLLARGELTVDLGSPGRDDLYGHGLINASMAVNAALSSGGNPAPTEARLTTSSNSLSFGSDNQSLELVLDHSGDSPVRVQNITSSEPWLSASAADVDPNGLGRYNVQVDRDGLADGIYSGTLTVQSSANTLEIRAQMGVGAAGAPDLGVLYVLLYHPETDTVVDQFVARAENGRYSYRFEEVVAGNYQVYAGTDADNDLLVCDAGEACGAWLTTDQPADLELNSNRSGIDFPVDYLVSLPSQQSADSTPGEKPGPRLQRKE